MAWDCPTASPLATANRSRPMWTTSSPCWTPPRLGTSASSRANPAPHCSLCCSPRLIRSGSEPSPCTPRSRAASSWDSLRTGLGSACLGSETFAREDLETAAPTIAGDVGAVRAGPPTSELQPARDRRPRWRNSGPRPTSATSCPSCAHRHWSSLGRERPISTSVVLSSTTSRRGSRAFIRSNSQVEISRTGSAIRAAFVAELEEFFTGARSPIDDERRGLATVLFTGHRGFDGPCGRARR